MVGTQQHEGRNGSQKQASAQQWQPGRGIRLVRRKVVRSGLIVVVVVTGMGIRAGVVMAMAAHGPAYVAVFPAKQVWGGQRPLQGRQAH
jgi:hypothetical protein